MFSGDYLKNAEIRSENVGIDTCGQQKQLNALVS